MSARKTKMTLDEHREMGLYLARANDELVGRSVTISNSKSKSDPRAGRVDRSLKRAIDGLRQARSELENMMFADYPEETRGQDALQVYYPTQVIRQAS